MDKKNVKQLLTFKTGCVKKEFKTFSITIEDARYADMHLKNLLSLGIMPWDIQSVISETCNEYLTTTANITGYVVYKMTLLFRRNKSEYADGGI